MLIDFIIVIVAAVFGYVAYYGINMDVHSTQEIFNKHALQIASTKLMAALEIADANSNITANTAFRNTRALLSDFMIAIATREDEV